MTNLTIISTDEPTTDTTTAPSIVPGAIYRDSIGIEVFTAGRQFAGVASFSRVGGVQIVTTKGMWQMAGFELVDEHPVCYCRFLAGGRQCDGCIEAAKVKAEAAQQRVSDQRRYEAYQDSYWRTEEFRRW